MSSLHRPASIASAVEHGEGGFVGRQTMWSGRRLLETQNLERFERLMRNAGAQELTFTRGQAVRRKTDSEKTKTRSLILITKGNVAVYPSSYMDWGDAPYFNPGAHRGVMLRGAGEFCGTLEFFLGAGEDDLTSYIVAVTESVQIMQVTVESDRGLPPLFAHLMPYSDVNELYESLARFVTERSTRADLVISNFNTKRVKHDETLSVEASVRAQILVRLRSKFKIPISHKCHHISFCMLKEGGNMANHPAATFFAALGRSGEPPGPCTRTARLDWTRSRPDQ